MIWLEGEDLSFFRGSIQTDKITNRFPKMMIGHMTIEGIAIVIDMAFEFPALCHSLAKSSLFILPVIAAILRRKASLSVLFKISQNIKAVSWVRFLICDKSPTFPWDWLWAVSDFSRRNTVTKQMKLIQQSNQVMPELLNPPTGS